MNKVKNLQNQWRGKVSRAAGEIFEKYIDAACRYYQEIGEADIEKTPEPMRVIQDLGKGVFKARFTKKAQPDYKGVLKGGRTIVFEAKHTDGIIIEQNRLTDTQWKGLKKYSELEAESFVLVSIKMQDFYFVPWIVWEAMKEIYGRKYMTVENLKPYQVPFRNNVIRFLEKTK